MTREEADEAVARLDTVDLYHAIKRACLHDVDPVWRAALARAAVRERRQTERALRACDISGGVSETGSLEAAPSL